MALMITLNGEPREVSVSSGAPMIDLLAELGLQRDRIAVEQNGTIVPRTGWAKAPIEDGDRLEIVHFVGGGAPGASLGTS